MNTQTTIIKSGMDYFIEGLSAYVDQQYERASELLTKSVETDSDISEAYFYLAKLYLKKKQPTRTQKIYRDLLLRQNLHPQFRKKIEIALIEVFVLLNKFSDARPLAENRVHQNPNDAQARLTLTQILERQNKFQEAQNHWQIYAKLEKIPDKPRLALYKVESARTEKSLPNKNKRLIFQQALKLDRKCAPAYILLGKLYQEEGKEKRVLETWNQLFENVPEKSHWIFNDMEQYLYELNRYHELLGIYQGLVRRTGAHRVSAQLALARQYYKIGKKDLAQETILSIQDSCPDKKIALQGLIQYYLEVDKNESTLSKIHALLTDFINSKEFTCDQCKKSSKEAEWHCPKCGAWNSYSP